MYVIVKRQNKADQVVDFRECMKLSRENYILLRLLRKMKKEEDRTNKLAKELVFQVDLDKEEWKLFKLMFREKFSE